MKRMVHCTILQAIIFTIALVNHTETKKHKSSRYWSDGWPHSRRQYNFQEISQRYLLHFPKKFNYVNNYEALVHHPLHHHSHTRHRQHHYTEEEESVNRRMRHTHMGRHINHGRKAKNAGSNTEATVTPVTIRRADFTRVHATLKRIKTFSSSLGPISRHLYDLKATTENTGANTGNNNITHSDISAVVENPTVVENSATTERSIAAENLPTAKNSDPTENSATQNTSNSFTQNSATENTSNSFTQNSATENTSNSFTQNSAAQNTVSSASDTVKNPTTESITSTEIADTTITV